MQIGIATPAAKRTLCDLGRLQTHSAAGQQGWRQQAATREYLLIVEQPAPARPAECVAEPNRHSCGDQQTTCRKHVHRNGDYRNDAEG